MTGKLTTGALGGTMGALCRRLRRCRRGNVAIEFGFMVPVFLMLAFAGVELGRLSVEWSRLTQAASAGTLYGVQDYASAFDNDGQEAAAREDAGDVTNQLAITAETVCICPGTTAELVCTTAPNCGDGKYAPAYVRVTIQEDLSAFLSYLNIPATYPITVSNMARVN
ncbi:MAG: pilus assembly protein [Alphaproteobacteria bacterium]|nr:pilus assembly protein [Alphaproteobacteria bacterium]